MKMAVTSLMAQAYFFRIEVFELPTGRPTRPSLGLKVSTPGVFLPLDPLEVFYVVRRALVQYGTWGRFE